MDPSGLIMVYNKINRSGLCLFACLSMQLFSGPLFAQDARTGTIDHLNQDNGSITISGQTLPYSDDVTEVFLNEQKIGSQKIDAGMVVRYTLDESGRLLRIELLGPNEKLRELELN